MSTYHQRINELSPAERRDLLAALLRETGGKHTSAPLSFAQERLWFLDQLTPGNIGYNLLAAFRLTGSLNIAALEQSLCEIAQRHEVLRTSFPVVEGKPVQCIAPAPILPLTVADLRPTTKSGREAEIQRLAMMEAQQPFDLAHGPLVRAKLVCLAEVEHILLFAVHHTVFDGWSLDVFLRELVVLYEAFCAGKAPSLPELPIQYSDFAIWQRQWLQGEVLETQLAYWRQQLSGNLPVLQLPTDRPHPPVQTYRGAWYGFSLPKELTEALKGLSQREGATLFMALLAAFTTVLARYTREEDIIVGVPIAGRTRREIEALIGFFVNTLALRIDLSGDPPFRTLLRRVRQVAMEAYAHQELPFEQLVTALQPKRDLSRNPLFQVMMNLQPARDHVCELPELTLTPVDIHRGAAQFEVLLDLRETAAGLEGGIEYNTDLFDATTIARLAGHLQTLLESIVAAPDRCVAELPLLTDAERQQLLVAWNATQAAYPKEACLHELFEAQVARSPEAVAVVSEEQQLTYADLNARANQLAHALRSLGVGPEVCVGLCAERSLEMVVGLLGILKAGGAYVPLDPEYPPERLAFMLADTQVPVVLSQKRLLGRLPRCEAQVLCLDADWPGFAEASIDNPSSGVRAEHLAYVIYTSGSTGQPKGVMNTHRGICNRLLWMQATYQLTAADRVLQKTPFSFDVSVWEFFWPLLFGARLIVAQPGGHRDSAYLVRLIVEQGVTTLHFVPSMLQAFLLEASVTRCHSLRRLLCSGEALSYELQARVFARLDVELHNLYGPTEAAVDVTHWACQRQSESQVVPIGYPVANTQLYVLDRHLQPVPVGVTGELHIGGVQVARGYLGRPELTAEKFIPDPFRTVPGARLYKTGDLARYRADGSIEFLGRFDDQVKLRGFRIELGEIEAVLEQHPAVRETIVVMQADDSSHQRLVAYVVPALASMPSIRELRHVVQQQLPEYMVPSVFVRLDELPLTLSGKVDRRLLPAAEPARGDGEMDVGAPGNAVEEELAGIWADVLGVERVGIHDNFFELGGDSILGLRIIARANQGGLRLTPKQLFQYQTISELAAVADTAPAVQAEQGVVTGLVPLTPIQRWFFERELPEPHHWNQAMLLEVRQALDLVVLEQAVQGLLQHHDMLRARFKLTASGWQQHLEVFEAAPVCTHVDLSTLSEAEQVAVVEATAIDLQGSLNLSKGPLVRVAFFDFGAHKPGRLLVVIHHLVIDGVSWRILLEDLQSAYRQLSHGEAVQLPVKTTSFQQWAAQLTAYAQSAELHQELSYWLKALDGPVPRLPVEVSGCANTVASAATVRVSLSLEETRALLQDVPSVYQTQINDVLLTALGQAFTRWTGASTLLIDLEGHGREAVVEGVNLARTVGWFTTIFPVVLHLEATSSPAAALKSIKEQLRGIPSRGIGYGLLRYLHPELESRNQLRALPQADVSFNYLGQFDQVLSHSPLFGVSQASTGPCLSARGSRRYLLEIECLIVDGRLQIDWIYSVNVHQQATVDALAQKFIEALRTLIGHCQSPEAGGYTPSDFSKMSLSQQELDALIGELDL